MKVMEGWWLGFRHFLGCRTDRRIQAGVGSEQNPMIFPISWVRADGKQRKRDSRDTEWTGCRHSWRSTSTKRKLLETWFSATIPPQSVVWRKRHRFSWWFRSSCRLSRYNRRFSHGLTFGYFSDAPIRSWNSHREATEKGNLNTLPCCSYSETMRVSFTTVQMFTPVVRSQTWIELPGGVVPYSRIPCWLLSARCEASRQAGCAFDQTRGNFFAFGVDFFWKSTSVFTPKSSDPKGTFVWKEFLFLIHHGWSDIHSLKNSQQCRHDMQTSRQMVWLACKLPKKRITDLSWIRVCWAMHLRKPEKTKCCMEGLDVSWFEKGRTRVDMSISAFLLGSVLSLTKFELRNSDLFRSR